MNKGDVVTVVAVRPYDLCVDNDLGGTTELPAGRYRVRLEKSWHDYEIGGRCIGILLDQKDIETSRKIGTTEYQPKKAGWRPERVFFGTTEIQK